MCFTTDDNRQIHTTAKQLLARVPKQNGGGTRLTMPKNRKRITAYLNGTKVTGTIASFDSGTRIVKIRPCDAIDKNEVVTVSFDTPAEKA